LRSDAPRVEWRMPTPEPAAIHPASDRWRSVRWQWPSGETWIAGSIIVYLMAVMWGVFPHLWLVGSIVAVPVGALAVYLLRGLWALGIAPFIVRFLPPAQDVPPPPDNSEAATEVFVRAPDINYPGLALAKGQCGWVVLRLRIDARGRIVAFRVGDQTPGRMFEAAVTSRLSMARLAPAKHADSPREANTVIVFPAEGNVTPTWARARLDAARVARRQK
jgi:hypothetical protein